MSQLTCCPHCHTCFKVAPEQLEAHQGLVRCGNCLQAFNALIHRLQQDHTVNPANDTLPLDNNQHQLDLDAVDTQHSPFSAAPAAPQVSRTWLWASLLLGLLAVSQLVYAWRGPLATQSPALSSLLNSSCQLFGCTIPLAQNATLVSIESSQLEADPKQQDIIILHAQIKNTAPYQQALPKLALTLNDINETLQARYILSANDYLKGAAALSRLEAGQEMSVELRLRLYDLHASGYRLELFY